MKYFNAFLIILCTAVLGLVWFYSYHGRPVMPCTEECRLELTLREPIAIKGMRIGFVGKETSCYFISGGYQSTWKIRCESGTGADKRSANLEDTLVYGASVFKIDSRVKDKVTFEIGSASSTSVFALPFADFEWSPVVDFTVENQMTIAAFKPVIKTAKFSYFVDGREISASLGNGLTN